MSIVLRAIDRDNWHECVRFALTPEQETFLPSNQFHVAEARFYPERALLGVYADTQMVTELLSGGVLRSPLSRFCIDPSLRATYSFRLR